MHRYTRGKNQLSKIIQNESSYLPTEEIDIKKNEIFTQVNNEQRKPSSSSISNNITAMNRLSINLCVFALSKLPFLILAIVTTVNLHHLASLGELSKSPCKTYHFGKIYFEVEALASTAAIIWIIGMIGDPIIVLLTDKALKEQFKRHMNYFKFKIFKWEPLPCFTSKE
uniref:G_PROTEIN_RECEP_F1_2 domain-containing protein n=1 Tax=Strongyloides papillosus TaxID=174720 RepID=A0A0N5B8P7_STREA